jgi:hypothetical protein
MRKRTSGNADTAPHADLTVVSPVQPGGTRIDRATELQRAARLQGGPAAGGVSVIAWLGYDTPGLDGSAVSDRLSQKGALQLDAFTDGLHAAHTEGPAHTTVVGRPQLPGGRLPGPRRRHRW